jgi:hypothetical protein
MMPVFWVLALSLLFGCTKTPWVQEGKSRWETRHDIAHCAEALWKERKMTIDTPDEERRTLLAPCMEAKGYQRR